VPKRYFAFPQDLSGQKFGITLAIANMQKGIRHILRKLPIIGRIISERGRLPEERNVLLKKVQALESLAIQERQTLLAERDRLLEERAVLLIKVAERDRLLEERDVLLMKVQALESLGETATGVTAARKRRNPRALTEEEIRNYKQKIDEYDKNVKWFHSLDLGNGLFTSGFATQEALEKRLRSLQIPEDLTGMTFLDIGSWDGYYAFEAEARGASRVMATDYFCWVGAGWGRKDGFLLAREILGSKVEDKNIEVQDLSPATVGIWDIVLFSGIFYHMRDPIQAMQAAASVASKCMIVETHIDHYDMSQPMMRYVPRDPNLAGNETSNYWRPNPAMILVLLKELGFSRVEHRIAIDHPGGPDDTHGFFNAYW
jgi:tRNA (mo5U34)-methyltransferase